MGRFFDALPYAGAQLALLYGAKGEIMARLIQCNILYFMGDLTEALRLAQAPLGSCEGNDTEVFHLLCMEYRCHLALGTPDQAEQAMLSMIRLAKTRPQCHPIYQALRSWANITTSWNGDSPRFYQANDGTKLPILDDRLADIRHGSARTTPLETPFLTYAQRHYTGAYSLRQYYMDLFHAMYWPAMGDEQQGRAYFLSLYEIARASGVYMPFVECGEQILPLLETMGKQNLPCSPQWLSHVADMAKSYEKHLSLYQAPLV